MNIMVTLNIMRLRKAPPGNSSLVTLSSGGMTSGLSKEQSRVDKAWPCQAHKSSAMIADLLIDKQKGSAIETNPAGQVHNQFAVRHE